jgi:hypothetical protein
LKHFNKPPKATPMLFSGELVRAMIGGNKTQTRRIMKPQPKLKDDGITHWWPSNIFQTMVTIDDPKSAGCPLAFKAGEICPFGDVGNLIYVRETFKVSENHFNDIAGQYCLHYQSDEGLLLIDPTIDNNDYLAYSILKKGNTPSIHMPRWASRLTLKITDVRVERVQDISSEDAKAEGFDYSSTDSAIKQGFAIGARTNFRHAWEKIYGESWNKNEWVWVIDFAVAHKNVDLVLAEIEKAP